MDNVIWVDDVEAPRQFNGRTQGVAVGGEVSPHHRAPFRVRRRTPRPVALICALIAAMAVLSSCLGPDEVDPTGTAPIGHLDLAVGDGSSIRLVGWALDPDSNAPIEVKVSSRQVLTSHVADRPRPDIAAAFGSGDAHGFDVRSQSLPPGTNQVCLWAVNVRRGTQDRLLGCRDVVTGTDDPTGSFDGLSQVNDSTVTAVGWGHDPNASGAVEIAFTVDGVSQPRARTSVPRPDVDAVLGKGIPYGFVANVAVPPGQHDVCATVVNVGAGSDRGIGCRRISVDAAPVVGPGGSITSVQAVGPPPGHPLTGIDRDAGVSTRLRDGSILWLFGDSAEPQDVQGWRYFVNNTAAWSRSPAPTVTLDGVAPGNVPYQFVTPIAAFETPCPAGFQPVMWPLSATNVPVGATNDDRVLAFFANVCLNETESKLRGVALAEWIYDPDVQHDRRPIVGTVLNQNVFPAGSEYGTAAVLSGSHLYAYACGRPSDDREGIVWPDDPAYTGCNVARVDPANAAVRSAWQYAGTGGTWSNLASSAAPMSVPGNPNGDRQLPVASLSVVHDPQYGGSRPYVMVYSPWPGYTAEVAVRTATSPTGPWSTRTLLQMPGCFEWANGADRLCHSATAQPWRSQPGLLGIGYYDEYVARNPVRGSYLAASAPFTG